MQDEDDERQDLERALYARPTGSDRDAALRAEAVRAEAARTQAQQAGAEQAKAQHSGAEHAKAQRRLPADSTQAPRAAPSDDAALPASPPRSRSVLLGAALLVGGLVVGAVTAATLGPAVPRPARSTATPTATPAADRLAALIEGWEATTDIPAGLSLIARGAEVYSPAFATAQDDRLLLTAPDGTRLCLALERPDGSLSAGCTGIEAFFAGDALDVVGTATGDGTPVFTRVTLRPDGTIEGGFQLVATPGPEA